MFLATHGILRRSSVETTPYANQYSFEFDGSLDYLTFQDFSNVSGLAFTDDFTLSAWIKADNVNTNQYIIDSSSDSGAGNGYSFRVRTDGKIRFWSYNASSTGLNSSTVLSANTWYHIACVHTSGMNRIYINGSLDATKTFSSGHSQTTTSTFRIGNSQLIASGSNYFNGHIDEVALYDVDMSSSISTIYNLGVPFDLNTLSDKPVSYYRMGELATYSNNWIIPDNGQQNNTLESVSMGTGSRTTDTP
ncbi:hypothetical protein [uncultured Mediterranean phage uvMED]|nr:hypothetical protein [uncultured Mediterranean phage uvMED]